MNEHPLISNEYDDPYEEYKRVFEARHPRPRKRKPMTITAHEAIARLSERLLLRGVSLLDIEIAAGGVLKVLVREDLNAWSKRVAVRALGPIEDETP